MSDQISVGLHPQRIPYGQRMHRTVALLAAIGVALVGCSTIGDESTTCQKFNGMSQNERGATIAKMFKERNGRNASASDIGRAVERTLTFCAPDGAQDKSVRDANP